jgi:hypothetical protein
MYVHTCTHREEERMTMSTKVYVGGVVETLAE